MAGNPSLPACLLALCVPTLWLVSSCTPLPVESSAPDAPPARAQPVPEESASTDQGQVQPRARSPVSPTARKDPPGTGPTADGPPCLRADDASCLHRMPALPGSVPPTSVAEPVTPGHVHAYLIDVLRDLDTAWVSWFAGNGLGEPEIYYTLILPGDTHTSHCRNPRTLKRIVVHHDHPNAYYCPVDPYDPDDPTSRQGTSDSDDGMIILPVTTLQRLWHADRTAADLAVALVLAHEFGHHVQHELALHWSERFPGAAPGFSGANRELIADCLAGTWLSTRYASGVLGAAAVDTAFAAVAGMGVPTSAGGYGSARERRDALLLGAAGRAPGDCIVRYWS